MQIAQAYQQVKRALSLPVDSVFYRSFEAVTLLSMLKLWDRSRVIRDGSRVVLAVVSRQLGMGGLSLKLSSKSNMVKKY